MEGCCWEFGGFQSSGEIVALSVATGRTTGSLRVCTGTGPAMLGLRQAPFPRGLAGQLGGPLAMAHRSG